jgi:hypothetical protein
MDSQRDCTGTFFTIEISTGVTILSVYFGTRPGIMCLVVPLLHVIDNQFLASFSEDVADLRGDTGIFEKVSCIG